MDVELGRAPELCRIGLRMRRGGLALWTALDFYPSALDAVRGKLLGGAFQARNGTGAWATVHVLEERPRGSWNSVPLAAPVLAQEVTERARAHTR